MSSSSPMNEQLLISSDQVCNGQPVVNRITPYSRSESGFDNSSGSSGCSARCSVTQLVGSAGNSSGSAPIITASRHNTDCNQQPNMKRQRVTSPQSNSSEQPHHHHAPHQQQQRTHVMPMFLCIPMLLLGLVHGTTASITSASATKIYRPNRPTAQSRPAHADDVDYGGVHPFDAHRHLFDPAFVAREAQQSKKNSGLRWRTGLNKRSLKKEEDEKDKDKQEDEKEKEDDKDKEKEEQKWQEEQNKKTDKPTNTPTRTPTKMPTKQLTNAPIKNTQNAQDNKGTSDTTADYASYNGVLLTFDTTPNIAASTSASTNTKSLTTLDPTNDSLYKPLRIQFDTRQLRRQMDIALEASDTIAATKLYLLIYEILPMTASVWGDVLRVIPVSGGIYPLAAQGSGVDQLLPNGQSNENDATAAEGFYEDPVRKMYCPDETTSGIEGGADLLVYATVNRHCPGTAGGGGSNGSGDGSKAENSDSQSMGTLASALSCQRDQYDRPITGSIDFCLERMKGTVSMNVERLLAQKEAEGMTSDMVGGEPGSDTWDGWKGVKKGTNSEAVAGNDEMIQYSVGVAVHEIGHVLGVTSDSLAFFRHPLTGHPLTRRPFELSTVTCVNGERTAYVGMPGPQVMQEGRHEGTGSRYFEVVTPTVQRVVRNHFNCQSMKGARLENQPTSSDCFGSHFDELHYYTEIMGAVFSQSVNILSPVTLAYLEDSGWYRANYESDYVQISMFGHGAGCDFIDGNCIDDKGRVPEAFEEQFCNTPISVSSSGLINTQDSGSQTCDPSHTQKTYCDLVNTNEMVAIGKEGSNKFLEPAPPKFQYFEGQPNMRPYVFTNADYCPVPHLDPKSCLELNGGQFTTSEQTEAGEVYGPESRCIETDDSRSYSLCLETRCNDRLGKVQITAGGQRRTCDYDGQLHEILYNYDGGGDLRIKCPKAALVCPNLFCPANCAGRGECKYASDREYDDDDYNSVALAKCVCDSEDDDTKGCYRTNLTFPAVYGYSYENPNKANMTLFMVIVGSLIAGLAVMFVAVRQWKARQNVFM
eukprot:CAMPEP_0172307978 /NCGR_PEP_ID=MMETSP1058-20130122/8715_1 /TAXON_ID=83371 /ORGANISM="Detonula confervacea, Strain CCMP 353" /LENGTH=1040 /DNA_ID=CAMNT_0013020301 /DNA_START=40 /DNA_END=3162 /DNA_ORIENTATION=+